MVKGYFVDFSNADAPVGYFGNRADKPSLEGSHNWIESSDPDAPLARNALAMDRDTHRFDVPTKSIVALTQQELDDKEPALAAAEFDMPAADQPLPEKRVRAAFAVARELINEVRVASALAPISKADFRQRVLDKL